MSKIRRALISVHDKSGIGQFAAFLKNQHGVEILSTGGTAKHLREGGLKITDVSDYTGFPEGLDGRVKTLHPMIHGGLLYLRGNTEHEDWCAKQGILPIDIGGPAMLRSAAKNYESIVVASEPNQYAIIQDQMARHDGRVCPQIRRLLMKATFAQTSQYDAAIALHFTENDLVAG